MTGTFLLAVSGLLAGLAVSVTALWRRRERAAGPQVRRSRHWPHEVDDLEASGLRSFVAEEAPDYRLSEGTPAPAPARSRFDPEATVEFPIPF